MLRRLQKMACATLALLLAVALLSSAFAMSVSVKVNSSSARVYKAPSTSSASLGLKKGMKLTVTDLTGEWARVKRGDNSGYVMVKYLNTTTRYKFFVNKQTYVYRSASSSSARASVSVNTVVYAVGRSGSYYRIENASGSATAYIKPKYLSRNRVSTGSSGGSSGTSWKSKVIKKDWFKGGESILKKGSYGYIYDYKTGIVVKLKRMGGHNHADVEPATASDTRKLLKIAGGKFSWDSHGVVLYAGGKYVACAINTLPHGDQTITNNNYDGQFCLHMLNSLCHGSGKINQEHQYNISKVYNWAH